MILAGYANFQEQRRPRTDSLRDGASSRQALEALENPFLEFMALNIMGKMSIDKLAPIFAEMCSPGHFLKHLPAPSHRGVVTPEQDIIAKPSQRSLHATAFWSFGMAAMICLAALAAVYTSAGNRMDVFSDKFQVYNAMSTISVTALWTVESYRPGFFFGPMYR